jgi:hypothetical protein
MFSGRQERGRVKKEALGDTVDRPPISRVGVFHFGKRNEGRPIVQLHCALDNEDAGSLKSSLLVLPEGFNVVGSYLKGYDHERTILSSLIELSRHFVLLTSLMETLCLFLLASVARTALGDIDLVAFSRQGHIEGCG